MKNPKENKTKKQRNRINLRICVNYQGAANKISGVAICRVNGRKVNDR